jgi:hypothetical protein
MPERVKMGQLKTDRRVWVRRRISLDHRACIVNELVSGRITPDDLPPLKVDRNTLTIVGGNHRFLALQQYYGNGWQEKEVNVEFLDLPPFEQAPHLWWKVALEDNQHLAERLDGHDRELVTRKVLQVLADPTAPEGMEFARLLHYTPQGWLEYVKVWQENVAKNRVVQLSACKPQKSIAQDYLPSDVKRAVEATPRALIAAYADKLLRVLDEVSPEYLTASDRAKLLELANRIGALIGEQVA